MRSVSRLLAKRLAIGKLFVTICNGRPDQQAGNLQSRGAAIEQDGVAIVNARGGGAGQLPLFLDLPGGAFLQGRQRGVVGGVDGPAVRAPHQAPLVQIVQVTPNGRFGYLNGTRGRPMPRTPDG